MPAINFQHNVVIGKDRDSAVQTTFSGSTVYSLPKKTSKRCMVDLVLMIIDDDGPVPMSNMRSTKKKRNAADQFDDDHHGEYKAMDQPPHNQIEQVHTHNNAFPKMYDELDKRRSIAMSWTKASPKLRPALWVKLTQTDSKLSSVAEWVATFIATSVEMTGLDPRQVELGTANSSFHQNVTARFDSTCPKCIKRKKRLEEERKKKGRASKNCRDKRKRKVSRNKLSRIIKQRVPKPGKQQSRCRSTMRASRPCVICSNKCFQCYIATETKTVSTAVSTFKSNDNLLAMAQESTPPNLPGINIKENIEKCLNHKSSHKKRIKKPGSLKSDVNPDSEHPSISSYNSFFSMEHEPMVE